MKSIKLLILLVSFVFTNVAFAGMFLHSTTLTKVQKKEIEEIIHDYLVNNPEVLIEASQALQQKQIQVKQKKVEQAARKNISLLLNPTNTPLLGNPKGSVTLIEFFDYQCLHCREMAPIIYDLVKDNKNLRILFKEFPIIGERSSALSRAALAAYLQGKYLPLHGVFMSSQKPLDDKQIIKLAKKAELDIDRFQMDIKENKVISKIIKDNDVLANKLHLDATPIFIITKTKVIKDVDHPVLVRFGSMSKEELLGAIDQVAK